MRFSSFSNQITKKTYTGPCRDSPGNSPRFWGNPRETPKVELPDGMMALVLHTKSIGQWPLTLISNT
jgi:hypothetical protein